uniref:Uncharacterized protein n=1 Tax=candidate division WOR-3 bacterium TaxID=2052148 RepID=A0A7C4YF17_UNCW3
MGLRNVKVIKICIFILFIFSLFIFAQGYNDSPILKWRYKAGFWVYSSPAIGSDGTIYFGSYDRCLYALRGEGSGLANSLWSRFRRDNRNNGSMIGKNRWELKD